MTTRCGQGNPGGISIPSEDMQITRRTCWRSMASTIRLIPVE
jgi:hypothetical protein